jgi:hypothetical protein
MSTSAKNIHIEALLNFTSLLLINQAASADHPLIAAHKEMVRTAYALPDLAPAGANVGGSTGSSPVPAETIVSSLRVRINDKAVFRAIKALDSLAEAAGRAKSALDLVNQAVPTSAICTGVVELIPGQQVFADPNADALRDILVNVISEGAKYENVMEASESAAKAFKAGLVAFAAPTPAL